MQKVQGPINHKVVIAHCHQDAQYKKALELAKKLYAKAKRKHTGIEYLSHPLTVGSLLLEAGKTGPAVVASALQDVLTHTSLQESTLRKEFGDEAANIVCALTPTKTEGSVDFEAYKAALARATPEVQTIKVASLLDEVCAIPAKKLVEEANFIAQSAELAGAMLHADSELSRRLQAALRRARS